MTVKKVDLVNRAYSKLKISGLTTNALPEEVKAAVDRLDDFVAALQWDIGYIQPDQYGKGDSQDDSGLTPDIVDPITTMLAEALAADFGDAKMALVSAPVFQKMLSNASATLARKFVEIEGSKYPETLPVGTANEYPNNYSGYFYTEGVYPLENESRD